VEKARFNINIDTANDDTRSLSIRLNDLEKLENFQLRVVRLQNNLELMMI
jgi:hypothetical protein